MKKIIRLTENDLMKLVKRVIREQQTDDNSSLLQPLKWSYIFEINNRRSLGSEIPPKGFRIISSNQNDILRIIDLGQAPGNLKANQIRFDFEVILKFDPIYNQSTHKVTKDQILSLLSQRTNVFTSGTGFAGLNQLTITSRGDEGKSLPLTTEMVSGKGDFGNYIKRYPINVDKMTITISYSDIGARTALANLYFPPTVGTKRNDVSQANFERFRDEIESVINDSNFNGEIQY